MDFLQKPPQWLVEATPEGLRDLIQGWGWFVLLGLGGLIILLLLWWLLKKMLGGARPNKVETFEPNLQEDLGAYPPLKPSTGDRQLRVEGVPVRMRLVVLAPAGHDQEVDADEAAAMLDRILPGLGAIYHGDKPRVKVWPRQLSYEGFAKHFHRNMLVPEPEGELSRWVLVAGRAKLGKQQIMLGLGLQAVKPTTVGKRTVDAHEWVTILRVRVPDA